jgi:hypothetical protein
MGTSVDRLQIPAPVCKVARGEAPSAEWMDLTGELPV